MVRQGYLFKTDTNHVLTGENMPAIASFEDLRAAQKDLLEAKDLNELKAVFKKWRRIGWKNICKLWLEERSPEQLKGERWVSLGNNFNS